MSSRRVLDLPKANRDLLDQAVIAHLATARPDGVGRSPCEDQPDTGPPEDEKRRSRSACGAVITDPDATSASSCTSGLSTDRPWPPSAASASGRRARPRCRSPTDV